MFAPNFVFPSALLLQKCPIKCYKSAPIRLQKCPGLQKFPTLVTKVPYRVTKVPFFGYKSAHSYGSLSLSLSLSLSRLSSFCKPCLFEVKFESLFCRCPAIELKLRTSHENCTLLRSEVYDFPLMTRVRAKLWR